MLTNAKIINLINEIFIPNEQFLRNFHMAFINPYIQKIKKLQNDIEQWKAVLKKEEKQLHWYENFDLNRMKSCKNELIDEKNSIEARLLDAKSEIETLQKHLCEISKNKSAFWKLKSFFSEEQRELRSRIKSVRSAMTKLEDNRLANTSKASELDTKINQCDADISKFLNFDETNSRGIISQLNLSIESVRPQIQTLQAKSKELIDLINDELDDLNDKKNELSSIQDDIETANEIDQELNSAENSYERAMAHQKCERLFGDSKPQRVKSNKQRQITSIERSISKIEQRIKTKVARHNRTIDHLIFDGNNFCYTDQTFIGLSALLPTLDELKESYKITVIFDASIRRLLKTNDQKIRKLLPKVIDLHVVATRQAADETILEYAAKQENTYVITNDRFADFSSNIVVKENRLIRHEIMANSVFIHDLEVSCGY